MLKDQIQVNLNEFNKLQKEMVDLGMKLGLSHPSVLEVSQRLDHIHNKMLKPSKTE